MDQYRYKQLRPLGKGGFGQVFSGYRRSDGVPVAIKRIPKEDVYYTKINKTGPRIPTEVAIMQRLMAKRDGSKAAAAPLALLDWFELENEVLLILERPIPCKDMMAYIDEKGGFLTEKEAQVIVKQLVAALLRLENQNVFHRDIKLENILIETEGDVPKVRIIDFGLSTVASKGKKFRTFSGTRCHTPPEFKTDGTYTPGSSTVWQLGALLYESLHKDTRFNTKYFTTQRQKIRSGLSHDCNSFLEACLVLNPLERSSLEQLLTHKWMK